MGTKKKYLFKEGEEVCHVDNPQQMMRVEQILLKSFARPTAEDPLKKENINIILGIKVHWWDTSNGKNKVFMTAKFHKSELIPYTLSDASYAEIQRWIAENT